MSISGAADRAYQFVVDMLIDISFQAVNAKENMKMNIVQETIELHSSKRCQMTNITAHIADVVKRSGVENGDCIVFCKHSSGAITITECADPQVLHDVLMTLDELVPHERSAYMHKEHDSDAHVKSCLVGCSEQLLIEGGKLVLGTWQGVYFCEFNGPRMRQYVVQVRG